jgi:hypothetical protein
MDSIVGAGPAPAPFPVPAAAPPPPPPSKEFTPGDFLYQNHLVDLEEDSREEYYLNLDVPFDVGESSTISTTRTTWLYLEVMRWTSTTTLLIHQNHHRQM